MDNATFDELPDRVKLAFVLETAAAMLGKETVKRYLDCMLPPLGDLMSHGSGHVAGEAVAPAPDYWGGVWQVYELE